MFEILKVYEITVSSQISPTTSVAMMIEAAMILMLSFS